MKNEDYVIYFMKEFKAIGGPWLAIDEIPDQAFNYLETDCEFSLELHKIDDVQFSKNFDWWMEVDDDE